MAKTPYNAGLPDQGPAFSATPTQPPTYLTSGSGTFFPKATTLWMRVTLLGGGAAGNSTTGSNNCTGGPAAKPVTYWIRKTKSSYNYAIGAGGAGVAAGTGNSGGDTTFDTFTGYGALQSGPNPTTLGMTYAGENSPYGKGSLWNSLAAATGYGAGGGGTDGASNAGGAGSGGLIIIEEY